MKVNTEIKVDGKFYTNLKEKNSYNLFTEDCIQETVSKLIHHKTTQNHPGMMLGKIQSGKTRTFIGVTGLELDNGFEVIIVLTKGTIALAHQTYERIKKEFATFIDEELVQLFDIMKMPNNLTKYELKQKLIIVAKKQKD